MVTTGHYRFLALLSGVEFGKKDMDGKRLSHYLDKSLSRLMSGLTIKTRVIKDVGIIKRLSE